MNIEELKKQLAEGKITKEQFIAKVKELLDAGSIDQAAHDAAVAEANKNQDDPPGGGDGGNEGFTNEQFTAIQKMLQSEGDKIRTQYSNEKKLLEDELEKLKTDKMTEEQKAEYERNKLQKDLEDREKALTAREVELHTIDKLTEAKLPLSFKRFLVGESKEVADENIADFTKVWQEEIKNHVDALFKEHGDDPHKNKKGAGVKKWSDMTLTEQGQLFRENPEQARKMARDAGTILK